MKIWLPNFVCIHISSLWRVPLMPFSSKNFNVTATLSGFINARRFLVKTDKRLEPNWRKESSIGKTAKTRMQGDSMKQNTS
jgi:hypothetical protein